MVQGGSGCRLWVLALRDWEFRCGVWHGLGFEFLEIISPMLENHMEDDMETRGFWGCTGYEFQGYCCPGLVGNEGIKQNKAAT